MELSVLTVCFRQEKKSLTNFLNSVYQNVGNLSFEVILVNNDKEELNYIRDYKNLFIVQNEKNVGFAKACNQAYLKSQGKVILFINPDTIVGNRAIERMHEKLLNSPDIGALGPKVVFPDGRLQHTFGSLPSWKYPMHELLNLDMHADQVSEPGPTDFLGGCCLMVKRAVWEHVGVFDENYFMYFEDADWCRRAKRKKIKLFYFPEVKITHLVHQSANQTGARQIDFYISEIYYFKKHFGFIFAFFIRLFISIFILLRIVAGYFKEGRRETREHLWKLMMKLWKVRN
jgi:GT2 family glycosyltransferase